MTEHAFTLIFDGTPNFDALFDAGCGDAMFGKVDGVQHAEFDRDADSLADAVISAIRAVESTGLRVLRVEPDDLVTASDIAARLGRSRESVRLLIAGRRGQGDFPAPTSHLRTRNRLWRWTDVAAWARELTAEQEHDARLLATVNATLELRNRSAELPDNEREAVASLA